jgi:glycosyltransferase involved in cell wall biosynthesis
LSQAASNVSKRHSISVIIPAYNRAGLIGETLCSLLNQTLPAREIIVVDDGSTDGTAEKTLEAFENWKLKTGNLKKDGREQFLVKSNIQNPILKILHQANAGPGAARNRGLAEATGEFIHFFDSDDIAALNKHEVQLQALLETGADIAYGPWCKGRFLPLEKLKHGKADRLKEDLTTKIHEKTRKGKRRAMPRETVLALRFQISPQASLHRILKTYRSLALRVALLLLSTLDARHSTPVRLRRTGSSSRRCWCITCWGGGCF